MREDQRDIRQLSRRERFSTAIAVNHSDRAVADDDRVHQHRPQPPTSQRAECGLEWIPGRDWSHVGGLALHHGTQHPRPVEVDDGLGEVGATAVLDPGRLEDLEGISVTNEDGDEVEGSAQEVDRDTDHAIAALLFAQRRQGLADAHSMFLAQARAIPRGQRRCFEGGWFRQ